MGLLKVLAISKRRPESCANQALLQAAGLQLLATDNLEASYKLAESELIRGVIVCRDSWSDTERDMIVNGLKAARVPLIKCPGCVGFDEVIGRAGTLDVLIPLTGLIESVSLPAHK